MKKVLFFLLLLVVTIAVIPLFLPKSMHVEKEYTYDASVHQVYNRFNDLTQFIKFDSWSAKDPNIELHFSEPSSGEGAYYEWKSKDKTLGDGKMTIIETKPNEFVRYELKFGDMTGNTAEVILQSSEDNQTRVIWSFDSAEASYPMQVFNMLMRGAVEDNLHNGLVNLDSLLQKSSGQPSTELQLGQINIVSQPAKKLFGVLQQTSTDNEEMRTAMDETFGLTYSYLHDANGLTAEEIGKPVVYWKQYNEEADNALFYCGYFIENDVNLPDEFEYADIPSGRYITAIHQGPYELLSETYAKLYTYAESENIQLSNETMDVYINGLGTQNDQGKKVQIYVPIID